MNLWCAMCGGEYGVGNLGFGRKARKVGKYGSQSLPGSKAGEAAMPEGRVNSGGGSP